MLNIETMSRADDGYTIIRLTSPKIQGHKDFEGATKLKAKNKMAKWIWDHLPGVALHKVCSKI
jgi:hypothetical protein